MSLRAALSILALLLLAGCVSGGASDPWPTARGGQTQGVPTRSLAWVICNKV